MADTARWREMLNLDDEKVSKKLSKLEVLEAIDNLVKKRIGIQYIGGKGYEIFSDDVLRMLYENNNSKQINIHEVCYVLEKLAEEELIEVEARGRVFENIGLFYYRPKPRKKHKT